MEKQEACKQDLNFAMVVAEQTGTPIVVLKMETAQGILDILNEKDKEGADE